MLWQFSVCVVQLLKSRSDFFPLANAVLARLMSTQDRPASDQEQRSPGVPFIFCGYCSRSGLIKRIVRLVGHTANPWPEERKLGFTRVYPGLCFLGHFGPRIGMSKLQRLSAYATLIFRSVERCFQITSRKVHELTATTRRR
jgi:hypothetical protein